jgi:type I restriction enzyme S subunit
MSNDTQPEIRFPGFTDDWEQRKLGEVSPLRGGFAFKSNKFVKEGIPIVRISNILSNGSVGGEFVYYTAQEKDENYLLPDKSALLAMSGATTGKVSILNNPNNNKVYQNQRVGYFTKTKNVDYSFISTLVRSKIFLDQLNSVLVAGAQPNISSKDINVFELTIPKNIEEQKKIGNFFKQLDDTIALQQRKLDLLKETKKGFLQKMFPKNGAKVPEIRFPGFTEAWEQRKLASMTNYKNGKGHEDKQSTIGKLELINLNSISISGGLKHSGKFIDEADDTLQKDDLVMILSDVGHGDLLGRVALIPEDDRFVLNQRVALLRPNATADPQFLFSYINAHQYYFKAQGAGMSQLNISKGSVENFISFVPIIEEQKKIGTFFKQLDDTIALHQRKLDLLKETKKGFLQKMFV